MPSANDIIERAMVKARIIYPGESIPADKLNQVYDELNDMIESWALEKLMLVADVLEDFTLTSGVSEYTYGSGGDFDSARPIEIKDECFIRSGGVDYPVRLRDLGVYRSITVKSTQGIPRLMAYNPEYPRGKVFLFPTPDSTYSFYIRAAKTLTGFSDKTTSVNFEPGYVRAIITNLAVEISPNFGKKVSKELAFAAQQAKKAIKSANSIPIKQSSLPDLCSLTGGGGQTIMEGPF